ncbi:hypothetical protein BN131_1697 [Cronobacter malonaticus 681]|nr:hypothetical protein BN131_1697 [Cronobacter malonaticus 681]
MASLAADLRRLVDQPNSHHIRQEFYNCLTGNPQATLQHVL